MEQEAEKPIVLLVDDEEEFLLATARVLGRRGLTVLTAGDGAQALQLLEQQRVDVMVLDIKMPVLSGEEVFARVQRDHPQLMVILLTGHGSISQAFTMSKQGAFDYLAKPCDCDELADKIHQAFRHPVFCRDLICRLRRASGGQRQLLKKFSLDSFKTFDASRRTGAPLLFLLRYRC